MPKKLPEIELFEKLTLLQNDPYYPDPTGILAATDSETVCNLYLWLLRSKDNHGFDVPEPKDIDQNFDKDFATHAILEVLNQFERVFQNSQEAALVNAETRINEATSYKDDSGGSRAAHTRRKRSQNAGFPCADREYMAINKMLASLEWQSDQVSVRSDRIRKIVSTIVQALASNEGIPLDDLPEGETRPATEVFCRTASQGNVEMLWFSDAHAVGWLRRRLDLLPKMNKEKYPGFVPIDDFNKALGRRPSREMNAELKEFLVKTLHDHTPIPTVTGNINPDKAIQWFRSAGGLGGKYKTETIGSVLYVQADILEPYVRKHLICGKTKAQKGWISASTIINQLELPKGALWFLALNLILYDLWTIKQEEVSDRLGIFKSSSSGFLDKIGINGHFYLDPGALGTLVTREMVCNKAEEIRRHEHRIIEDLKTRVKAGTEAALPERP